MTKVQVERWYRRLWAKITEGDGYQPFGYDMRTLDLVVPGFRPARDRLRALWLAAS